MAYRLAPYEVAELPRRRDRVARALRQIAHGVVGVFKILLLAGGISLGATAIVLGIGALIAQLAKGGL